MRARVIVGATAAAVGAAALGRLRFRRYAIVESSMEPALHSGDWVLARRRKGELERGDIVVTRDPNLPAIDLVKRVIGLPGEHVAIEGGRVTVDGALLADRWASGLTRPDGEWIVDEESVWLLGDHRARSASDGRSTGPTAIAAIDWVVVVRYWPRERAGSVR